MSMSGFLGSEALLAYSVLLDTWHCTKKCHVMRLHEPIKFILTSATAVHT